MEVGNKVTINVSKTDECYGVLGKLNGKTATISRKVAVRNSHYYELEGVNAASGIPYAFCEEHLEILT